MMPLNAISLTSFVCDAVLQFPKILGFPGKYVSGFPLSREMVLWEIEKPYNSPIIDQIIDLIYHKTFCVISFFEAIANSFQCLCGTFDIFCFPFVVRD